MVTANAAHAEAHLSELLVARTERELAARGARRVNTILPGIFDTPLINAASPQVKEALAASVTFPKRLGRPPEYTELALTKIACGYLNGESVRLDSAIRMAPG